jgi:hypothetical protein
MHVTAKHALKHSYSISQVHLGYNAAVKHYRLDAQTVTRMHSRQATKSSHKATYLGALYSQSVTKYEKVSIVSFVALLGFSFGV